MPAADVASRDQLLVQLADLKEDGIKALVAKLTPPGEGDDTPARYALESLAIYLTQSGRGSQRKAFSAALTEALAQDLHEEIKAFLIRRLQFTGQSQEVVALQSFIGHPYLTEASIRALINIGGPEAETALVDAFDRVNGPEKIELIKAFGQMSSAQANQKIIPLLTNADPALKSVIFYTLAQSADPKVNDILLQAAARADYRYTQEGATQALLDYGFKVQEAGNLKSAKKVAKTILKKAHAPEQMAARTQALHLLLAAQPERSEKLLQQAIKHEDKAYRQAALALANSLPGEAVTQNWAKEMAKNPDPVKEEIISMLGKRGDPTALPTLLTYLEHDNDAVKLAALRAVSSLDKENGIKQSLNFLERNDHLAMPVKQILLPLVGNADLAHLAAEVPKLAVSGQTALIQIIAARQGTDYFELVYPFTTQQQPELRAAALQALQDISTAGNVDQLVVLLPELKTPEEEEAVNAAILAALQDLEETSKSREKALSLLKKQGNKKNILAISPQLGGDDLLQAVIKEYRDGSYQEEAFTALANWQGASVAPELFHILSDSGASRFRDQAFKGYLKAARSEDLPLDQQLLMLRKAMPFASDKAEKNAILQAAANTRTFLAFQFVCSYLDDLQLQQTAAMAAMNIALPKPDETHGLYGKEVSDGLLKVLRVLDGPESQYYKIDIQNYLDNMPEGIGFLPMFNGKDLSGWQGFVGNPYKKHLLYPEELAEKQKEADEAMLETWSAKDGAIVFNGKGHNLVSAKVYGDFEMIVDWRITKDGDSGIYLRGTPQVQIWDTARVEVGAQVGSGGLYNNQKGERNPLVLADNAIGDWNTFRITMIGEKVTVYLNGQLVVDEVPLENYWDRSLPIMPAGPIELQAHGTDLAFRDIYIREIASPDFSLQPAEKLEGFVSLFNGRDLEGWVGNKTAYQAKHGQIVVDPKGGGGGNLFTQKEYSDFNFRFEFQLTPGANNGLGIHAPLEGDAAYMGKELQILDNTAPVYANLKPYQYHGSVYGIIPAKRGYLKPVGEWNEEEVIVQGSKIKIILNGTTIVDGDFKEASKDGTMDGRDHPGLERVKGHIGFLGHGSALKFRNIRIKEL